MTLFYVLIAVGLQVAFMERGIPWGQWWYKTTFWPAWLTYVLADKYLLP